MTLSTAEIESVRFHLGYGNVAVGALPYTDDGYWSVFDQLVSVYLGTGTETSATTAITSGSTTEVTPAAMTGIAVYGQLVVDTADQAEVVVVKATTISTFTAYFAKAHTAYPISTMCGKARLRMMLHDADTAWRALGAVSVGASGGLKSVDKGDVVWQDASGSSNQAVAGRMAHYGAICRSISALVRVPLRGSGNSGAVMLEAY
jgi:hypothetical protein